jgi:hypothetical protein
VSCFQCRFTEGVRPGQRLDGSVGMESPQLLSNPIPFALWNGQAFLTYSAVLGWSMTSAEPQTYGISDLPGSATRGALPMLSSEK